MKWECLGLVATTSRTWGRLAKSRAPVVSVVGWEKHCSTVTREGSQPVADVQTRSIRRSSGRTLTAAVYRRIV